MEDVLDDGRRFTAHVIRRVSKKRQEENVELVTGKRWKWRENAERFKQIIATTTIQMVFPVVRDVPQEWDFFQQTDAQRHVVDKFEQLHRGLGLDAIRPDNRWCCCQWLLQLILESDHLLFGQQEKLNYDGPRTKKLTKARGGWSRCDRVTGLARQTVGSKIKAAADYRFIPLSLPSVSIDWLGSSSSGRKSTG